MSDKEMLLDFQNRYHGALEEIGKLEEKLNVAIEALEFYEDENNFTIAGESGEFFWVQNDYREASEKARQALSKIKEVKSE